jgi:hypothetical protein
VFLFPIKEEYTQSAILTSRSLIGDATRGYLGNTHFIERRWYPMRSSSFYRTVQHLLLLVKPPHHLINYQKHHPINYQNQIEGQKMKSMKLVIIAAIGCMSVAFLSGSAQAQIGGPDLQGEVDDYCAEVDQNVESTLSELGDASGDLGVCSGEFKACMLGQGIFDKPSICFRDYKRCIRIGTRDQKQACQAFLLEWGNDTRRAERSAKRDGILSLFRDWLHGDTTIVDDPTSEECLAAAFFVSDVCTDKETGQPDPPPDDDLNTVEAWCNRNLCEEDEALFNQCVSFMNVCLLEANTGPDREECAGAGLLICVDLF